MALAELLAPTVVVTQDSVFSRFGAPSARAKWIETTQGLLRAVGFEASLADSVVATELVLRLVGAGATGLTSVAQRHPLISAGVLAGAAWLGHRKGYLDWGGWRSGAAKAYELA
ncbi:hypothetical protein GXW83_15555 [Streptacidiphilus sp. PB12-B1b]|uniref:hypothetical protein n=1 Tax=Streptacidiphilus sp. PB12-B1b TaxID=2705012 RepID=UPI0015FC4372|nr:hypothetical protein [Streptacidiphilus sp. PB12-B1b]QMU76925.1 hypothetical protein GXW83_15555 [Streptacidiphilus sp. PB12-B1b]